MTALTIFIQYKTILNIDPTIYDKGGDKNDGSYRNKSFYKVQGIFW